MHFADYKTILSAKNGMNLYRGCTHGCIYCDSRSACYQMDHDFEDIEVKRNAPQMLETELKCRRKPCMIGTGAMTDPYIPLEEKLGYTRSCLELIDHYGFGLAIQTKSALILRDLNLLISINKKAKCVVQITMTTADEDLCRIIEPKVSTTFERFQVLEKMRDAGIPTVVWLSPILPYINDTEENLDGILDYCIRSEVRAILNFGFGLTIREGNREYLYQMLDRSFPGMKEKYMRTFGKAYICHSPDNEKLARKLRSVCKDHNILLDHKELFDYLQRYVSQNRQISLFD
ncbi:MAG: radical SAM protein [Clostridiaceae bacterium]|nr:radical SAM protein [Clostridiaceae bacterium]